MEFIGTNNRLVIHKNVRVMGTLFCSYRGDNCIIEIGDDTYIVGCNIYAAEGGKVNSGADCMLGDKITIMQSACHPMIDNDTGKRCNYVKDINVGTHVWLGQNVSLMPGFSIGNGSIVGYGSISSSKFADNCTIAGNPARVIRENCTWKRDAVGYEEKS